MSNETNTGLADKLKSTEAELDKQIKNLEASRADIDKLQKQLARVLTDNEALAGQNTKLFEENEKCLKQAQEFGDLNHLLTNKAHRLEQDLIEMGKQRDVYKESNDRKDRQIAGLIERLERQKMLNRPEPTVL